MPKSLNGFETPFVVCDNKPFIVKLHVVHSIFSNFFKTVVNEHLKKIICESNDWFQVVPFKRHFSAVNNLHMHIQKSFINISVLFLYLLSYLGLRYFY